MILERTIEIRIRMRCDGCKRVHGCVNRRVAPEAAEMSLTDEVRRELKIADGTLKEGLTGEEWEAKAGRHLCPHCAAIGRSMRDLGLT